MTSGLEVGVPSMFRSYEKVLTLPLERIWALVLSWQEHVLGFVIRDGLNDKNFDRRIDVGRLISFFAKSTRIGRTFHLPMI